MATKNWLYNSKKNLFLVVELTLISVSSITAVRPHIKKEESFMNIKKALSVTVTAENAVRTAASLTADVKDKSSSNAFAHLSAGGKADRYCSAKAFVKGSSHYS